MEAKHVYLPNMHGVLGCNLSTAETHTQWYTPVMPAQGRQEDGKYIVMLGYIGVQASMHYIDILSQNEKRKQTTLQIQTEMIILSPFGKT